MNGWQHLSKTDPEIAALVATEIRRERSTLELVASENFASRAVLEATGSVFTNKYAEGYPGRRYYGGCEPTDGVETLARDRVKALFGAEHANVQPHSGTQANMAVYIAACTPGDTIMGLDLAHGGHLTHGHPLNFSGKYFKVVAYGVRKSDELLDYEQMERLADENKPKLIVAGASAYSRQWDYERIAAIAKHVGARVMVDIAHVAGLIAAGLHPNPVPHADYVTTTTHKTLRGPRGGVVLCKEEHAKDINRAVFPGGQGGPLVHVIAAKAVSFKEAKGEAFKKYQQQVIANAQTLAKALADGGHRIVTGGTDTHLFLVDVFSRGVTGKVAEEALEKASVTVNKNTIPFDQNKPLVASGIRIGTPAVTTRGMGETEMKEIAAIIGWVLDKPDDDSVADSARARVRRLCDEFPLYPDLEQMSAALLPVFLDLSGRLVVVTGTTPGSLAFALRACALGARVRLVGTGAGGHAVAGAESVDAVPTAAHLAGASLLVAGSASSEDDAAITAEADARGVTTIRLDGTGHAFAGEASGAGRVAVAATTRGASSELERRIAADAAQSLRPEHERMADILATIRGKLEERFPDESLRSAIWEQILDSPVMVLLESGEDDAAAEMAERMAWGTG